MNRIARAMGPYLRASASLCPQHTRHDGGRCVRASTRGRLTLHSLTPNARGGDIRLCARLRVYQVYGSAAGGRAGGFCRRPPAIYPLPAHVRTLDRRRCAAPRAGGFSGVAYNDYPEDADWIRTTRRHRAHARARADQILKPSFSDAGTGARRTVRLKSGSSTTDALRHRGRVIAGAYDGAKLRV
jgi:hypothetical protein